MGIGARTIVEHVFYNPHDRAVEGTFRYPLPPEVLIRLPMPPAGHEFVRVASDILLIAVGTGMVIDAVEDLGR